MVWPTDKPSIEAKVFDYFRAHIPADERRYHGITNVRQNDAENDLDGTVETTRGDILIDVAEVAPLEKLRGRYDDANAAATIGELADALTSVVFKKSQKYAGITPRPWLLLYTTHWAFNPTSRHIGDASTPRHEFRSDEMGDWPCLAITLCIARAVNDLRAAERR
jgi:hypothetical protein